MSATYNIFGDTKPFLPPPWQTKDDRVRGGASQSSLSALPGNGARFIGNLDIQKLGGAGFASQFSPRLDANGQQAGWDLNAYDGIQISLGKTDGKIYTLILKDETSSDEREDGREKAGINWEVDINADKDGLQVWKPWRDFKAFYRGKEKEVAGELKKNQVVQIGLMMRSYFGTQEGDFDLELKSISAG